MDDAREEYVFNWLRNVGAAFLKERRREFVVLEDGHCLILEYPTKADAHAAALDIETIKRMAREDARATAAAGLP